MAPTDRWAGPMREALALAAEAAAREDVPVGAVVVGPDGDVLGRGHNVRERDADPTEAETVPAFDRVRSGPTPPGR